MLDTYFNVIKIIPKSHISTRMHYELEQVFFSKGHQEHGFDTFSKMISRVECPPFQTVGLQETSFRHLG